MVLQGCFSLTLAVCVDDVLLVKRQTVRKDAGIITLKQQEVRCTPAAGLAFAVKR